MKTLRNIFRRPLRTSLTILGIIIGVTALIVLGAMAEKINLLVEGGQEYYAGKVTVTDASSPNVFFPQPLPANVERQVRDVEGVSAAFAMAYVLINKEELASFGPPPTLYGIQTQMRRHETFETTIANGRRLRDGDREALVVGSDLQAKYDAQVGDRLTLRGHTFDVVGILEKQLNGVDNSAFTTFEDIQEIYRKDVPSALVERLPDVPLASQITAFPESGEDIDELADRIEQQVPRTLAIGPESFIKAVEQGTRIFNLIVISVSLVSLIVGGLSIINTMMMNVNERVREIGIRKAVGATDAKIVAQFMREAVLISTLGGLIGLALGASATAVINSQTAETGLVLFTLTPRLVIGAVVFSTVLGMLAGIIPAVRAARLDPVRALRYQ